MPEFRYMMHPGAGQNPAVSGAQRVAVTGTNFVWLEQLFPTGQDKRSDFQGISIPPTILPASNVTWRCVFRQLGPSVGSNVVIDLRYANVTGGPRDVAPTAIGPQIVAAAGAVDGEFTAIFTAPSAGFVGDQELPFQVHRIGSDAADDLGADIALVRVDVLIPASDSFIFESEWDGNHPILGAYELWVDAAGRLRIKNGPPAFDEDGTIVGTQS